MLFSVSSSMASCKASLSLTFSAWVDSSCCFSLPMRSASQAPARGITQVIPGAGHLFLHVMEAQIHLAQGLMQLPPILSPSPLSGRALHGPATS